MIITAQIPLGWFQLIRQPKRLLAAVLGIALGTWLVFMQTGFERVLLNSATALYRALDAQLVIIARDSRSLSGLVPFARNRLYRTAGVAGVSTVQPIQVFTMPVRRIASSRPLNLLAIGIDPANAPLPLPDGEQQILSRLNHLLLDAEASPSVRASLVKPFEQQGPFTLELLDRSRDIRLAGLFRLGQAFTGDGLVLMSDATLQQALPGRLSPGAIQLGGIVLEPGLRADPLAGASVQREIARLLPPELEVLTRQQLEARERTYWSRATAIGYIFRFGTVMGLIVSAVIVYQVLFNDVIDHQAEYATLRAIGFRQHYLQGVVIQQALLLAVMGFVPGFLISAFFYALTRQATGLPLSFSEAQILSVFVQIILTGLASGLLTLRPLAQVDPAEIL